jgi:hypothetical protein
VAKAKKQAKRAPRRRQHHLTAAPLSVDAPIFDRPTLSQAHRLKTPGQHHNLKPASLAVGPPGIDGEPRSVKSSIVGSATRPGRPSSKDLIRTEAERRLVNSSAPDRLKKLATDLADWLHDAHPEAPQVRPKTIENNIRDLWREYRPAIEQSP